MSSRDDARSRDARDTGDPREQQLLPELLPSVESLPGLARVAASAAWHTTEWSVRTSARAWMRVGRAAVDQREAAALASDAGRALSVVGELTRSVSSGTPMGKALVTAGATLGGLVRESDADGSAHGSHGSSGRHEPDVVPGQVVERRDQPVAAPTLRERGQELLEASRDVWRSEEGHPAFARILEELAPDEARILMLLIDQGPQPSVDVRTGGPIGRVSSQLIALGLTMIGPRAGCRYVERVPSYLDNLHRLGLVWFSREPLRDASEYQVVEAQPDVLEAMHAVKFPKVVRRSIHLTPFGTDFCRTCLLPEAAADAAFPAHATPDDAP